jgi:uncharacterized protein YkwD
MQRGTVRQRAAVALVAACAVIASVASSLITADAPDDRASSVASIRHTADSDDDRPFIEALRQRRLASPPSEFNVRPTVAEVLVFFHVLGGGASQGARVASPAGSQAAAVAPAAPRSAAAPSVAVPVPTAAPPTAVPPPQPAPEPQRAAGVWVDAVFTTAVFDGVNARRQRAGLPPLSSDARLTRAASDYAVLMSETGWFSHTGPDGSSFVDRIVAAGFPFTAQVGEVLAMGTNGWPAADVVQAWMDSPPHREQLMNGAYRLAGVACAFTRGGGTLTVRCAMEFAA